MFRLRSLFLQRVGIMQANVTILVDVFKAIAEKCYISTNKIELLIQNICVIGLRTGLAPHKLANDIILENGSCILLKHPITEVIPKR